MLLAFSLSKAGFRENRNYWNNLNGRGMCNVLWEREMTLSSFFLSHKVCHSSFSDLDFLWVKNWLELSEYIPQEPLVFSVLVKDFAFKLRWLCGPDLLQNCTELGIGLWDVYGDMRFGHEFWGSNYRISCVHIPQISAYLDVAQKLASVTIILLLLGSVCAHRHILLF